MTNIVISGANGKMGHNIFNCADAREDCTVVAGIDLYTKQYADFPIVETPAQLPVKPDVIIDFSNPSCNRTTAKHHTQNGFIIADISIPEMLIKPIKYIL